MADDQAKTKPSQYELVDHSTEQVARRLKEEFDKWPLIHFFMDFFGSLVYWAAQRLIDREAKKGEHRARDEAVIESCPRLFSDCYAGYLLASRGLILQSAALLRSSFEVTTQTILFMEREDMAAKWLRGEKIKPKQVRELTSMPESQRKLYNKLSALTHPNYDAFRYFSVPVPLKGNLAKASAYGGWYAPKAAGQIAIQFLWAQLVFLEHFYTVYNDDLREQGLLWRPETVDQAFGGAHPEASTWQQYLSEWRDTLLKLTEDHDKNTPDDIPELALAMSDYAPEEKERWRRGWEELSAKERHSPRTTPPRS